MKTIHASPTTLLDFSQLEQTESRQKIAKMLMKLFDHWELNSEQRLQLLGLSENSRALLPKYAKGQDPIPNRRDSLDRAGYLLSIHKALRLLYPENPITRYKWVNLRNKAFDNYTPLEVMINEGIVGLARVNRYLDFMRGF